MQTLRMFSAQPAVGLQILGKLVHHRGLAPLAGEQQPRGFQVVEQADVVVAAARGGLVQAHRGDGGEVLLRPGGVDVVVEGAPYATVAHPQELGDLAHRHGPRQGHDQGLHQLGEPAALPRPGHRHLGGLAAGLAAHPRDLGADVRLVLEEVQMPPLPLLGVVHRLVLGPAVRADEAAPRGEADPKVDAPGLGIEGHLGHLPRRLQAQGHGEQRGRSHGVPPARRPTKMGSRKRNLRRTAAPPAAGPARRDRLLRPSGAPGSGSRMPPCYQRSVSPRGVPGAGSQPPLPTPNGTDPSSWPPTSPTPRGSASTAMSAPAAAGLEKGSPRGAGQWGAVLCRPGAPATDPRRIRRPR